jgi:hypothetical protein
LNKDDVLITVAIPSRLETNKHPWLMADSLKDLRRHEPEIVERIARIPNGGNLFMINPFLLLDEIGVSLSEKAQQEMVELEPTLSSRSSIAYQFLRSSQTPQRIRFHVKGLFRRG